MPTIVTRITIEVKSIYSQSRVDVRLLMTARDVNFPL